MFILQNYLTQYLLRYVQDNYDQSATVTANQIECINISTAIFKLQFTGLVANDTLQQLQNDISSSVQGLNIGIGVLKLCEQNCTWQTITKDPGNDVDGDKYNIFKETVFIVVTAVILLLLVILFICGLLVLYKGYVQYVCSAVAINL